MAPFSDTRVTHSLCPQVWGTVSMPSLLMQQYMQLATSYTMPVVSFHW